MNYEEELAKIELEKQKTLTDQNNVYSGLINENETIYNQQNQKVDEWKNLQDSLINNQVTFNQDQLNRSKEEANKSYQQEALASNVDYQKFINPYGANREQQVASGVANAGYSETTKLGAYNTAQNRTSLARATTEKIKADFDAKIQEARLNGDTQLAQIALQQMQMQMENALKQFDYKSSMSMNQLQLGQQTDSNYYGRSQDLLTRKTQAQAQQEAIRQYNEQMAYKKQQDAIAQQNWLKEYKLAKEKASAAATSPTLTDTTKETTTQANSKKYNANMSPSLSNGNANAWFDQNIGMNAVKNGGLTATQLNDILTSGLQTNKITQADVTKIARAFGLL